MHMSNNELIIMIIIIEKVCPNEMQTLCIAAISTKDYIYPLPSDRQHPSYSDCVEVKREYYQNCSDSSSSSSRTYRLTWHKLNTIASRTVHK